MNGLVLASLFTFISCSHEPLRTIASKSRPTNLNVDVQKSSINLIDEKSYLLDMKNDLYEEIEISSTEVQAKNHRGKLVPFQLQRVGSGKYYVLLLSKEKEVEISVQGKVIGRKIKTYSTKPHIEQSRIDIISKEEQSLVLQLKLADEKGRPIISEVIPEIILEGEGSIEHVRALGKGLWELKLIYPEHNTILYLSVRTHGAYLERIFRFQHVEK